MATQLINVLPVGPNSNWDCSCGYSYLHSIAVRLYYSLHAYFVYWPYIINAAVECLQLHVCLPKFKTVVMKPCLCIPESYSIKQVYQPSQTLISFPVANLLSSWVLYEVIVCNNMVYSFILCTLSTWYNASLHKVTVHWITTSWTRP